MSKSLYPRTTDQYSEETILLLLLDHCSLQVPGSILCLAAFLHHNFVYSVSILNFDVHLSILELDLEVYGTEQELLLVKWFENID